MVTIVRGGGLNLDEVRLDNGLLQKIESTRQLMIQSGIENGLHSRKTLRLSKQVDYLMNKFNQCYQSDLTIAIQNRHLK